MSKNTKPAKSPTPATKSTTPVAAPKSAAKIAPKPAPVPVPVAAPKATKAPASKKVAAPVAKPAAPAVKPVAAKPLVTVITAKIDIGFGNALYVRGEGAGLSWDHGLLLTCVADDKWSVTLGESVRPIIFKFLVNDLSWSAGEDYVIAPGSSAVLVPTF